MKRYSVTITIAVSAESKQEAQRIFKEIVESGAAMGSDGNKIAKVKLYSDPIVNTLPF